MSGNSTDRVIDFQFLVDEFDEENDDSPGNDANDEGTGNADSIAASRNGD